MIEAGAATQRECAAGVEVERAHAVAAELRSYLESGVAPPGLFTDDVFCDFTFHSVGFRRRAGIRCPVRCRGGGARE